MANIRKLESLWSRVEVFLAFDWEDQEVLQQMRPVSVVIAQDDQMMNAIRQLNVSEPTLGQVEDCIQAQPLPKHKARRACIDRDKD